MKARMDETTSDISENETRRDFLVLATRTVGATGLALSAWPFIDSMNPSSDALAISSVDLDLDKVAAGQRITANWRGIPVFIYHRTPEQIAMTQADDGSNLPDPQADSARVQRNEWLVVIGICTHLGCVPIGQRRGEQKGNFGGWFCRCHGSQYDTSGRIRKGPAPRNLDLPAYSFLDGTTIRIG